MSEDTIRLAVIGRIFRRRWRLLAVVAAAGALAGFGVSLLFPPRYATSAAVLLQGEWEERELRTQAEIATSSVVLDRAADALGWPGTGGAGLRDQVSAGTADGNIIEISATAGSPRRAQQLADRVAGQFVGYAARIARAGGGGPAAERPEELRELVVRTSRRISELAGATDPGRTVESVQARTELAQLRTSLEEAMAKLEQADSQTDKGTMVVMGPAARPGGEAPPTRVQLVGAGALLFFLAAVVGHLAAARASRRTRTAPEIGAALGAAPLGTVDVPAGLAARRRPDGRGARARTRRLLGTDTRWDTPPPQTSGDESSRRIRYRRVCARLRDRLPPGRGLLVVVPDGDEIGRGAAERLIAEYEAAEGPGAGPGRGHPAPRLVEVSAARPTVPDREAESGALVVLSAGNCTAAELTGIAEACADAAHEVVGFVVAGAVRARTARPAGRPAEPAAPEAAVGYGTGGGPW
ncbi:polysaccharide biosynthesis protein [Streptomyces sp. MAR4 CNX-425]|uniref:polysaccharide biosynthesis protein n=1 Tax=Streptomyces sp. MAR4 CNX-425 TaxID=3406343 RepID=UPI003B509D5C